MNLKLFLSCIFLMSLLDHSSAKGEAVSLEDRRKSIEGVWTEVTQGCNYEMPAAELKTLPYKGANSFYFTTLLVISDWSYTSTHRRGSGCQEGFNIHHKLEGHTIPLYCGDFMRSEGAITPLTHHDRYKFDGKAIVTDGGYFEGLGVHYKDVRIQRVEDVLITEQIGTMQCGHNMLMRYWIPTPSS